MYEKSPLWAKRLYASIPFNIRIGKEYRRAYQLILKTEKWSRADLEDLQLSKLKELIEHAYRNVPYYARVMKERGLTPSDIRRLRDIEKLPLLTKEDIRNNWRDMFARNASKSEMFSMTTGGTSGKPLKLYIDNSAWPKEWAFLNVLRRQVGYTPRERMATFRGVPFPATRGDYGTIYKYNPMYNELLLSPFQLTKPIMEKYVRLIQAFQPRYFHGYPSALEIFAKFVKQQGYQQELPRIRAFFAISETLWQHQRETIEEVFNLRVFSHYGQSERVIFAGECEESTDYHVYPQYGVTELIDESGDVITEPGKEGELVGTSFLNTVMPFIRYRTGDGAMLNGYSCPRCGREYLVINDVKGRWTQEMLVGKGGNLISITALNMHSFIFKNIVQFRFVQRKPGKAILKIIPAEGYGTRDKERIEREFDAKVGSQLEISIKEVKDLPRTGQGKHQFLDQGLDLEDYR